MKVPATLHSSTDEKYGLSDAILLYRGYHQRPVFASVHEVSIKKGKPVIEAGVAVSKSGLVDMLKCLAPQDFVKPVLLDSHILAYGSNHLAWYCPPKKRDIWFACKEVGGEVTAKTEHPGLVFIVIGGQWFVYAVKGNRRPTASTQLYAAPYLNVWVGGGICVGNIDTPKGAKKFSTEAWEDAFFRTYFTHTNAQASKTITKYRGGVYSLWRALLKGRAFPYESLAPMGKTLGQVFDGLVAKSESGRD